MLSLKTGNHNNIQLCFSVQQHLSADVYGLVTSSMPMLTELGGGPCGDVIAKVSVKARL